MPLVALSSCAAVALYCVSAYTAGMADIDTKTVLEAEIQAPRRVTADGVTVEQPSIADQIKLAQYLDGRNATRKTGYLGCRLQKIRPPGGD